MVEFLVYIPSFTPKKNPKILIKLMIRYIKVSISYA